MATISRHAVALSAPVLASSTISVQFAPLFADASYRIREPAAHAHIVKNDKDARRKK
ncbi:MAG TPA: hypothetical protein PL191_01850 [Candidatus Saccharimonas sp.]|nr:hypothetical protein [Candidatus Saccharimonas sp.]